MRFRALTACALLGASLVAQGAAQAAPRGSVSLPAAKSACGVVRLVAPTTLDVLAALRTATSGYRVVFVRQLDREEPLEIVGVRVADIGARPGPGEPVRLGAEEDVRVPAGRYRLCVFSDRPRAVAIPAAGLPGGLTVRLGPVRSAAWSPAALTTGLPGRQEVSALHDVSATRTSLVLAAGVVRVDASTPMTWDDEACLVRKAESCDGGSLLYGTGTSMTSGRFTEAAWTWWPNDLLPPGAYLAGFFYRGTQAPAYLRGWALQADL